ncbi:hypothetical protein Tco_0262274 [Tanacetum coccineum]
MRGWQRHDGWLGCFRSIAPVAWRLECGVARGTRLLGLIIVYCCTALDVGQMLWWGDRGKSLVEGDFERENGSIVMLARGHWGWKWPSGRCLFYDGMMYIRLSVHFDKKRKKCRKLRMGVFYTDLDEGGEIMKFEDRKFDWKTEFHI